MIDSTTFILVLLLVSILSSVGGYFIGLWRFNLQRLRLLEELEDKAIVNKLLKEFINETDNGNVRATDS